MSNIEHVKHIYSAFARGDIPEILRHVSETVEWENTGEPTDVPWLIPRHGRAGVSEFFAAVELLQINAFEPKTFLETGDRVIVLVDEDVTVKATGRRLREDDQVHLWSFDARGAIVRHRQRLNTYLHWTAYHDR